MQILLRIPCLLSVLLTSLGLVLAPQISVAQDDALLAVKRQLAVVEEQLKKALERIEQLEKEKSGAAVESQPREAVEPQATARSGAQSPASKGTSPSFNPAISVNGLFLGGYSSSPRKTTEFAGLDFHNGFNFQEAEFQFTADVDPYWKANFILAINRAGETELEEGYVTSEQLPYDLLPQNTSLKLGKFFAAFGKHNLLHAHQYPFIHQPLINQAAFGEEGLREPGVGVAYLLPTPWFSELTFQGLAGENDVLFRSSEEAQRRGAYLGHWKNFFELGDSTTLEVGNSYVGGRSSNARRLAQAVGLDLTLKWRPPQMAAERGLIWQSEYIYFTRDGQRENGGGLFSALQYQFARRWWIQGRYDLLGVPKLDDGRGHRWSTLLAFVPSEFSAIRLQHSYTSQERRSPLNEILLQFNFTIGSHPAHQY